MIKLIALRFHNTCNNEELRGWILGRMYNNLFLLVVLLVNQKVEYAISTDKIYECKGNQIV